MFKENIIIHRGDEIKKFNFYPTMIKIMAVSSKRIEVHTIILYVLVVILIINIILLWFFLYRLKKKETFRSDQCMSLDQCRDACSGGHHTPGDPFYLDIIENDKTIRTMLNCTCSDYNMNIDTFDSTISFTSEGLCRMHTVNSSCGTKCDWKYYDILNKEITFEVYVGAVPCGRNFTVYFSKLKKDDEYCDAQMGKGCTEIDIMECNAFSWHTTLHKGNGDGDGTPVGYGGTITDDKYKFKETITKSTTNTYGYGSQYIINTKSPFIVSFRIKADDSQITQTDITLTQNGQSVSSTYPEPYAGYFKELYEELNYKQNVLIFSYWIGGMAWMDTPPCPQDTPEQSKDIYVKNVVIRSL